MAFHQNKVFRIIGFVLITLMVAGFGLRLVDEVLLRGNWLGTYRSGSLVQWTYSSALIVLVVASLIGLVAVTLRVWAWLRKR